MINTVVLSNNHLDMSDAITLILHWVYLARALKQGDFGGGH